MNFVDFYINRASEYKKKKKKKKKTNAMTFQPQPVGHLT